MQSTRDPEAGTMSPSRARETDPIMRTMAMERVEDAVSLSSGMGGVKARQRKGPGKKYMLNRRVFKPSYPFYLLVASMLAPSFLFCLVYAVLCSETRFLRPQLTMSLLCVFLVVVFALMVALPLMVVGRKLQGLAITTTLAVAVGFGCGELNYLYNFYPYFMLNSLERRANINPSTVAAEAIRDTGKIYFADNVGVLKHRGMAYQDWDTYCVAPIVEKGNERLVSYEFWAIGMNCCEAGNMDFSKCGAVSDDHARSGIRLMYPEQLPFFKLAVEQSEAQFGIQAAANPVFVYWVKDPVQEVKGLKILGLEAFIYGCMMWLPVNGVLAFMLTSSKYG